MAKLADALDLGSSGATLESSSLSVRTILKILIIGKALEKVFNQLEGCERELVVTLTADELKPHYEKAYNKARPTIDIKGFRKGRVPLGVIKKYFGPQIEADAHQDIIGEVFSKLTQDDEVVVVGQPGLTNIEMEENGAIKFTVKFETLPEIELKDYKSLTIDEPVHAVEEDEIQKELENIALNHGKFEEADEVTDDKFSVTLSMLEVDKDNNEPVEGATEQPANIFMANPNLLPVIKRNLEGAKIDHTFVFTPSEDDPNAPAKYFRARVSHIQKLVPVEMTDEWVKDYTRGKFDKFDDFKSEIGFNIQDQWDKRSRAEMENQIIDQLIDMHDEFAVPESVVEEVMKSMVEDMKKRYAQQPEIANMITLENMRGNLQPAAERNVRWEIIRGRIIEKEMIKLEDHDIEDIVESEAERLKRDKATVKEMVLNNANIHNSLLVKKVMDFLMDFAETNDVPFEEYEKRMQTEDMLNQMSYLDDVNEEGEEVENKDEE